MAPYLPERKVLRIAAGEGHETAAEDLDFDDAGEECWACYCYDAIARVKLIGLENTKDHRVKTCAV